MSTIGRWDITSSTESVRREKAGHYWDKEKYTIAEDIHWNIIWLTEDVHLKDGTLGDKQYIDFENRTLQ